MQEPPYFDKIYLVMYVNKFLEDGYLLLPVLKAAERFRDVIIDRQVGHGKVLRVLPKLCLH